MFRLRQLMAYPFFLLRSQSCRRLHSPYLLSVFRPAAGRIRPRPGLRKLRSALRRDDRLVRGIDHGAGSRSKVRHPRVGQLASSSSMPLRRAAFLSGLAREAGVTKVIELGTSLGLTSLALEAAGDELQVITIEGNAGIADVARENFRKEGQGRIVLLTGRFRDLLQDVLNEHPDTGMVLVDDDHTEEGTIRYFTAIMETLGEAIIVFDDIRWSEGMASAWQRICEPRPDTACLDFFRFGIVIRRYGLSPQYLRCTY